ncbi:hypothetical protein N7499_000656 [Penicillium canescens]|uniref:Uncharacterized protein n=1 Tax=Penicillium canescens TaxID=5083 RepID=A0AAD6IHU6_PENCN|nr:uncharacterized protein N7446_011144 [Penicillium canescens]KAJ6006994.1 hypothetical protein N7522_005345 [Penicillium canescens]KAJ6029508.1 hypothetical protein N7444_012495 [Penicillium canescens]KAJ6047939.1 hypothetical protein N7460_004086 [Penicillium canescens]KAJ6048461.1 hypothetical protein N7446_011144 [Penicillium canescens]KAJ6101026.1 hypothetical protein N7499_000656 [Penicillium canescens]
MSGTDDTLPPYQANDPLAYETVATPKTNSTFYHIHRPLSDYQVYSENQQLAFYVEVYTRNITKPDLIIYKGTRTPGRQIAQCRYGEKASSIQCDTGFFKASHKSNQSHGKMFVGWWSKSTRDAPSDVQYRFAAMIEPPPGVNGVQSSTTKIPHSFKWIKASSLTLLDEETGNVVALVHENVSNSTACGTLEMVVSYGDEFDLIALSSFIAIFEKQRRHRSSHMEVPEAKACGKLRGLIDGWRKD